MIEIIPLIIIGVSFIFFLWLHSRRKPETDAPSRLRRVWRWIVETWNFITNFG